MGRELRFDDRVAIVTGAGQGLGRAHALLLASRGAKVVVNDLGGGATGGGKSAKVADQVVAEIIEAGGEAVANYDSVEDGERIVQTAIDTWGRVDVVVNNAGILRDSSFHKMSPEDWDLIYRVHVLGSFRVTHAAWPHMREAGYGRVVMTASAAGIYGNFGQANYSMAKLGLVGLSNTLAIEGHKRDIRVNTVAPLAGSRLTETVLPKELVDALDPAYVSPLVAWLCHEDCRDNGGLFEVGGGFFAKLRWERAEGKTFRIGRPMSIERVVSAWDEIAGFEETTHPTNVTESLGPALANVQAGPSRGGNEFIDVDEALGFEFPPMESSYDERDLALYALGVGAGRDPLDDKDLQVVYELHNKGFKALPTYAVLPALSSVLKMAKEGKQAPGLNYGFERILHGEQYTEVMRPLPPHAKLTHRMQIKDIFDKGKHALIISEASSYDESGELLARNEITFLVKGAGGWGGDRGPSAEVNVPPDREPDAVVEETTDPAQALLYRLSGDWNPLHADPNFAKAFGFDKPILHGLCTYGYVGRHVINTFCGGDPRYFKSIKVRFADSVYPGETLVTRMWKESDTRIVFLTKVKERDSVVISNAAIELYPEIPKPKPKAPPKAEPEAAPAPVSAEPISADVFTALGQYVAADSGIVGRVGCVYQFQLTDPDSVWTMDLKNGAGAVVPGDEPAPECTLTLRDADFMAMVRGEADAQKLYFGGQLKISGNVMASQKLELLTKLDPALVMEAARARAGGAGAGAPPPPAGSKSAAIFAAIGAYVGEHPELVDRIGTVYQFQLSDPDSVWTVDLKAGSVAEGETVAPECTLALSDADFMGMVRGELDAQKLYFGGQLKISGNVMASQKLEFLQKIDPKQIEAAMAKGATASAPAAPAKKKQARTPQAPAVIAALAARLEENPGLADEVGAVVQLQVTEPDARWTMSLTARPGAITEGFEGKADGRLTLTDKDLEAVARGELALADAFQRGRLRVDGDVSIAHRLVFLGTLLK